MRITKKEYNKMIKRLNKEDIQRDIKRVSFNQEYLKGLFLGFKGGIELNRSYIKNEKNKTN